jgi:hypothetical protein
MEAVHEGGKTLVIFPCPCAAAEYRRIDARIEVEQEASEPRLPVVGKQLAQRSSLVFEASNGGRRSGPAGSVLAYCILRANPTVSPDIGKRQQKD